MATRATGSKLLQQLVAAAQADQVMAELEERWAELEKEVKGDLFCIDAYRKVSYTCLPTAAEAHTLGCKGNWVATKDEAMHCTGSSLVLNSTALLCRKIATVRMIQAVAGAHAASARLESILDGCSRAAPCYSDYSY